MIDNNKIRKNEYFLATTALEKYWETDKSIIFIGKWCKRYSREEYISQLDTKLIQSPWLDRKVCISADKYLNELIEKLLPRLTQTLNHIHNVNMSSRYWRILIYPWLHQYLNVLYERFIVIKNAITIYPEFITIILSDESYVTPESTMDFVNLMKRDDYNLQIYSKVLFFFGKKFKSKPHDIRGENKRGVVGTKKNIKSYAYLFINKLYGYLGKKDAVVLSSSYFTRFFEFSLFLKTRFLVRPVYQFDNVDRPMATSASIRDRVKNIIAPENEFESFLNVVLQDDIPLCYLENYKALDAEAEKIFPREPKAIFSTTHWYFNETFKHWSANLAESGTIILAAQHGGNHGSTEQMPIMENELSFANYYFSWGWSWNEFKSKIIPMPATKLVGRKKIGACNNNAGILFAGSEMPRYPRWVLVDQQLFHSRMSTQFEFAKSLPVNIADKLIVRFNPAKHGWDLAERWNDLKLNISTDNPENTFWESLNSCRLFVTNHLSTTFAEALSANVPTVLFWDPIYTELRPEAKPYYDSLIDVGILFYDSEKAAQAVASIYDDIESWWNNPERQSVVANFCDKYIRTSKDDLEQWSSVFEEIYKEGKIKL